MKEKLLFLEKQKFNQLWLWIILIIANVIGAITFYRELVQSTQENQKLVLFYFLLLVLVSILVYSITLTTKITEKEIRIQFFPFHLKERIYLFSDLDKAEVVQYNPLLDYGGWGIRYGIKGKAFNIRGNKGLKITFKSNKKRLIGTQKPEELKKIIDSIFSQNDENN